MSDPLVVKGRAWLFGEDNLNTDLMMPQTVFGKSLEEQVRHVFATYRPGWVDEVRAGDILWVDAISEPGRVVRLRCS